VPAEKNAKRLPLLPTFIWRFAENLPPQSVRLARFSAFNAVRVSVKGLLGMETEPARPTGAPSGVQPPEHHRGLVTLLFSDVVGSTALKQALGDRAGVALLQQHHEQSRQVLRGFGGEEAMGGKQGGAQ